MPRSSTASMRRTAADWQAIVARFRHSGLTQRAFCRRDGIGLTSLQRWCQQYPPARDAFLDLLPAASDPAAASAAVDWSIELVLPHGVILRLRG